MTNARPTEPGSVAEGLFHYLPIDESTYEWGAYLTSIGRVTIPPASNSAAYPPKGHPAVYDFNWRRGRVLPEFALLLLSEGAGVFESEATGEIRFEQPMLGLLFPGVWHRYRPLTERGWTERWICFSGTTSHLLFGNNLVPPAKALAPLTDMQAITDRFDGLLQTVHCNPTRNSLSLSLSGLSVVAEAMAHFVEDREGSHREVNANPKPNLHTTDGLVKQAIELIWTGSHRRLSISELAKEINVNRRTLERRFVRAVGHSIRDEINSCRLSRAKRLLTETEFPVKTVAYLSGYPDYERLRVAMVASEGVSPSRFREGK